MILEPESLYIDVSEGKSIEFECVGIILLKNAIWLPQPL